MEKDINDLVLNLIEGDREAFAELVRTYKKRIYAVAYRMLGNHPDADEVTQETFVRIFEKRRELRNVKYFSGFLMRIACNYAIDLLRKRQRRFISIEDEVDSSPMTQAELSLKIPSPDREVENAELSSLLNQAIGMLPPRQKMTVILHDVEGYSMTEVAEAMRCPEATVRSNLHVARTRLRKWLVKRVQ
jgi:RNA polymerase sigma-70 factor (ECF subfamily)